MDFTKIEIPAFHNVDTSNIAIEECNEKMINLSDMKNERIIFEPVYFNNGISGAVKECYMRKTVYEKLCSALEFLPQNFKFKVFDAWRPDEVQQHLFNKQVEKLINSQGISVEEATEKAKLFVSFPSKDAKKPFVHSTGGAIDLTIVDENNNELDMGTGFDDFSEKAATNYYENSDETTINNNRKLLYFVMINAGFTNYSAEWWHYDFGDAFWAFEKNQKAIYGGIFDI